MARISSHTVVLRMKRSTRDITTVQGRNATIETVEHIAVTDRRRVLMKTTIITYTQGNIPEITRVYGKWIHKERIRPRVDIRSYQYAHTQDGWITVPLERA